MISAAPQQACGRLACGVSSAGERLAQPPIIEGRVEHGTSGTEVHRWSQQAGPPHSPPRPNLACIHAEAGEFEEDRRRAKSRSTASQRKSVDVGHADSDQAFVHLGGRVELGLTLPFPSGWPTHRAHLAGQGEAS